MPAVELSFECSLKIDTEKENSLLSRRADGYCPLGEPPLICRLQLRSEWKEKLTSKR